MDLRVIINHDCTLVEVKEGDGIIEQRNTHRTHIHGCPKARAPLPNRGSFLALKDSSARNNNNNYIVKRAWHGTVSILDLCGWKRVPLWRFLRDDFKYFIIENQGNDIFSYLKNT